MPNPLAAIAAIMSSKPSSGASKRGVHIPSFGPRAGASAPAPATMSLGGSQPSQSAIDILSRPKRTRRKGYKKTAQNPGQVKGGGMAKLDALPDVAGTDVG